MKVLILNGSPHLNGDTMYIVKKLKERFSDDTEFVQINAYRDDIKPCVDCRYCWKNKGCSIKDKMEIVTKDDYDIIVIASPVYMYHVTPPLFSIITRLNYLWSNKYFLDIPNDIKKKKGILILSGGGDGKPDNAIEISKLAFKFLHADFDIKKDYIYSLNTNNVSAEDDVEVVGQIEKTMKYILK